MSKRGRNMIQFHVDGELMTINHMYIKYKYDGCAPLSTVKSRYLRLKKDYISLREVNEMLDPERRRIVKRSTSTETPIFSTNLWKPPSHAVGE